MNVELLESLQLTLGYIGFAVAFINGVICFFLIRRNHIEIQYFNYYIILNLIIQVISYIFWEYGKNNLPFLHLFTLFEFILLSFFYKVILVQERYNRRFISFVLFVSVLIIGNSLLIQGIYSFNSYSKSLEQVIIIVYSILYFFFYPKNLSNDRKLLQSINLINSAILVYFSGSLFIFMFSQIFIDKPDLYRGFWAFNVLLVFLFQLLVFISLWRIAFRKQT